SLGLLYGSGSMDSGGFVARPDQVSLGVLVAVVLRFKVDEAARCGTAAKYSNHRNRPRPAAAPSSLEVTAMTATDPST
ncbi:hypothetical protein, partial [Actinacidiphila soli]|uniref:hypothetical protein n=1 Tax=Actinacidiphila soli TaxID=2487275 RepID=UPI0019D194FE